MKKINKLLLLGFFVIAVFLLSKAISPINKDILQDSQKAAVFNAVTTPINPVSFWQFSGNTTTDQKTPTVGSQQFGGAETPTWSVGTGGMVGNYMDEVVIGNTAGSLTPGTNGWTVEFLMKPGKKFSSGVIFSYGSGFSFEHITPEVGNGGPLFMPAWVFRVNNTPNYMYLDGVGRKSLNYYADDNFHHFVVQYDPTALASSNKLQLWVDGQLVPGFSLNQTVSTSGNVIFSNKNSGGYSYNDCDCDLDQIALYNTALPPALIIQHKINANDGLVYATTAPSHNEITDTVVGQYDPLDYMNGMSLTSLSATGQNPGVTVSVLDQLKSYPLPRLKQGHGLIPNVNWMDSSYMANNGSSSISGNTVGNYQANWTKAKEINRQLGTKWNYHFELYQGTGEFGSGLVELANDPAYLSPKIPTSIVTLRNNFYGGSTCGGTAYGGCIRYQGFPATHYLQNASGQFLDQNGNVTTNKIWRPVSNFVTSYDPDGLYVKNNFQSLMNALPNRRAAFPNKVIDIWNENGEVFPLISVDAALKDPVVVPQQVASGLPMDQYLARRFYENERRYVEIVKSPSMTSSIPSAPNLSAIGIPEMRDTVFTEYNIEGKSGFDAPWTETSKVLDSINNQKYSTSDFYVSYPFGWPFWIGYRHGFGWANMTRNEEISTGNNLFSPYVAAGWDNDERENMRPGQALGFAKALSIMGAEFFYTGYFNVEPTPAQNGYPENWAWQAVYPTYAQGTTSHYEDILRGGKVMKGDTPGKDFPVDYSFPGFRFFSSDPSDLVVARKKDGVNKFVIFGQKNAWSNWRGDAPEESIASIAFGGNTLPVTTAVPVENLKFKVRRQGSTYIYDKTVSPAVFYQLDTWHESSHPHYWSKDFSFEAEVYDTGTATRTTTVPAGTPAGDYTTFTTYINPASGATTYNFEPRDAAGNTNKTYYAWALVKSATGSSSGQLKIDALTSQTISTSSPTFVWCRATNPFTVVANSQHTLTFTGTSSNFQADKFLLTTNSALNLGNCGGTPGDTTAPTVSITAPANGATITTGPVSVTANASDNVAVSSVEFKVDGNSIGIDNSSPYTASWSLTGVADGTHTITATATDSSGNTANSSITVTKSTPDTTPPSVPSTLSVSRSGNNASLAWGASTDSGSGLAGYYVYRDGSTTALNTTAITGTGYTDTPSANTNHTYTVKAKDNAGNLSAASNQVSINIDTLGPTITSITPVTGTYSGTITLSANTVSDSSMIDRIEFYRGGTTMICNIPGNNQTTGTFTCSWDTTSVTNATYSITAKAYDKATPQNSTTSSANSITVNNVVVPPPDTTAPTAPTNLTATAVSTSQVNLSWSASTDNVGVTGYKVYRCTGAGCTPTTQIGTTTTTTYSNTNLTGATTYVYRVTANDAAGNNSAYSASATATTQTAGQPDVIVTDISWSPASPLTGQNVVLSATIKNQGTAATPAGIITGVQFLVDDVSWGCADGNNTSIAAGASVTVTMGTGTSYCATATGAIHTSWNATAGSHSITAIVDDINRYAESNETNNTTSETVTVGSDTTAPTIGITGPTNGTVVTGGSTVTIAANASDASGIQDVKFYIDGAQYGATDTASPYSISWNTTGFTAGNHTLTAVATDNAGNSATSTAVTVSITTTVADTIAPTVTFACPSSNCNVSNSTAVEFIATATDNVAVTQVKFFLGATSTTPKCTLTTPTTSPSTYSCKITIGSAWSWWKKTINVQARDEAGNITTKSIQVY